MPCAAEAFGPGALWPGLRLRKAKTQLLEAQLAAVAPPNLDALDAFGGREQARDVAGEEIVAHCLTGDRAFRFEPAEDVEKRRPGAIKPDDGEPLERRVRRGHAYLDVESSLFCSVREKQRAPLCNFYAAAAAEALRAFGVSARGRAERCRAVEGTTCSMTIDIGDRLNGPGSAERTAS